MKSVVVVGPGAMGLLFASGLHRAGLRVSLLDHRAERAALLNRAGIRLRKDELEERFRIPVLASPQEMQEIPSVDAILFCVKATATATAASFARPLMRENTIAVTLQNGLGNAERLADAFGADRVLVGTTSEGATLLEPGLVRHAGSGVTRIGSMTPGRAEAVKRVVSAFSEAGFEAEAVSDWRVAVWEKAIVNAAINPVTALLGVRNGLLAEWATAREVVQALAREAIAIAQAEGIDVSPTLADHVIDVCRATAANRSSMLQDVDGARTTELEYLNGRLLSEARRHRIDAPVLNVVTQLARAREQAARIAANGERSTREP